MHGSLHAAVSARPLASTALSSCLAALSEADGRRVGAGPPPPGGGALGPPPPAGSPGVAVIVTVRVAVAVRPSSSFARTTTVRLPGASKRRDSVRDAPVCTTVPSTV